MHKNDLLFQSFQFEYWLEILAANGLKDFGTINQTSELPRSKLARVTYRG